MYANIYLDIILDKEVPTELLNDMQRPPQPRKYF